MYEFEDGTRAVWSCFIDAQPVTPNDNTDLPNGIAKGLFIGGAGNVEVITSMGTTVEFQGLTAGTVLPVVVTRVKSTNTTATNILALY